MTDEDLQLIFIRVHAIGGLNLLESHGYNQLEPQLSTRHFAWVIQFSFPKGCASSQWSTSISGELHKKIQMKSTSTSRCTSCFRELFPDRSRLSEESRVESFCNGNDVSVYVKVDSIYVKIIEYFSSTLRYIAQSHPTQTQVSTILSRRFRLAPNSSTRIHGNLLRDFH